MKLPSIHYLVQAGKKAFLRFPLSISSSFIGVCCSIYLFEYREDISNIFPYLNIMLCATLGVSLFFCVDVYAESKAYPLKIKLALRGLAVIILIALYFTLPGFDSTQNTTLPYIRYGLYSVTVHLLVAFIPFLGVTLLNGFWHYNRILFIRFLTSFLYSAFLYGGLALALGSLYFLFDIDLHNELFFDLFILIAGLFNTWFFVSGIPTNFNALEDINEYPKGIKIFSQFILLPLLILYLLLLYGYASKIIILATWPKGIVSYLISSVAVLGIFTLLLIYPYGNLQGNAWIRKFGKAYYFALFPLIVLLFISIGMRISDYGLTINRYAIFLLGVWLTIVCIYFAVGKTNIKFIPISLAVILVAVSFGYWGLFAVSERSQVNRLKAILEQEKILSAGAIQYEILWNKDSLPALHSPRGEDFNEHVLPDSLHNEVKSILDYLDTHHGFSAIRRWYSQDIDSITIAANKNKKSWKRFNEAEVYMKSIGLKYEYKYNTSAVNENYNYYSDGNNQRVTRLHKYDYLFAINHYYNGDQDSFYIDSRKYKIDYDLDNYQVLLKTNFDTAYFKLNTMLENIQANYGQNKNYQSIPDREMELNVSTATYEAKLQTKSIGWSQEKDSIEITSLEGDLLIKLKK